MPSPVVEKRMERYTLLAGGVEMTIGAAMAAFPTVFPSWLTLIALLIAIVTTGVACTLIWSDVSRLTAAIGPKFVGLIGPTITVIGLALTIGLGVWFFMQAPEGFFAGSNTLLILVGLIVIMTFVFLTVGRLPQEGRSPESPAGHQLSQIENLETALRGRIDSVANSIRNENTEIFNKIFALKTAYEMRALKREIDRLILLLNRPVKMMEPDWSNWPDRFKKFVLAMSKFENLASVYFPKESSSLTFVNPSIYRINEGDFAAALFPDHQTAHDFKTFRQMSNAYENLGVGMLERIEAKT